MIKYANGFFTLKTFTSNFFNSYKNYKQLFNKVNTFLFILFLTMYTFLYFVL
ncbi:hypothetical protein HMPREF9554_00517, partial [Treponema phagedenis F0421]